MSSARSLWAAVAAALALSAAIALGTAEAAIYSMKHDPSSYLYTIHLPTQVGADAKIIFADGTEESVGRVLAVPTSTRWPGFTASKYGIGGQVIATAANTLHIQISLEDGAGRTMSIVPMRTYVAASSTDSSFVIEGEGGFGIWGSLAPFVGDPVYIINRAGVPVLFNDPQMYQYAQAVQIHVYAPVIDVEFLEVENRKGGRAWYRASDGDHEFGIVERAVTATGRFEGTVFEGIGMVRANHPGVLCISTSERGRVGGFQIVPRSHTFNQEMRKTRNMNQYIIVRGVDFEDLTGRPPFFRGVVRPADESVAGSTEGRVFCRIDGAWHEMPETHGLTQHTMEQIEAFRIYVKQSDLADMGEILPSPPATASGYMKDTELYVPQDDDFDSNALLNELRESIAAEDAAEIKD